VFPSFCTPAPYDHPNVRKACELVRMWNVAFSQFQSIIDCVGVFVDSRWPDDRVLGSMSHHLGFGKIVCTLNNHVGFAAGLVHEMAHQKLRALGVEMEFAEQLICNSPSELFMSPIRHDSLRPMSAVLHAQYSFTYVAALMIVIIRARLEPARDLLIAKEYLSILLPKLEFGLAIIEKNAVTDDIGSAFLEGYADWLERILREGAEILEGFEISPVPFVHPLDTRLKYPKRLGNVNDVNVLDELLLYSSAQELGVALNNSARAVWHLCDGEHTIDEIVNELGKRVGCSERAVLYTLHGDVVNIIIQLHELGFMA
jgi:hypothetical protein